MIKNTINKFLHDSLPNLRIAVIGRSNGRSLCFW